MTTRNHHEWISAAADRIVVGGSELWRALCSSWVDTCADRAVLDQMTEIIQSTLDGIPVATHPKASDRPPTPSAAESAPVIQVSPTESSESSPEQPEEPVPKQRGLFNYNDFQQLISE